MCASACGGNGPNATPDPSPDTGGTEADTSINANEPAPPNPLAFESTSGCRIDADCKKGRFCYQNSCIYECETDDDCSGESTCSKRGECLVSGDPGSLTRTVRNAASPGRPSQALRDLEIVGRPDTRRTIEADQKSVTFEWKLEGDIPPEGIPYRVDRSDGRTDPSRLRYASGDESFSVQLKAGKASPQAEQSGPVSADIRTPLGNFSVYMKPKPTWTGTWRGEVTLDSLAGQAIPLEIWLVGDSRDDLKMALPVRPGHLFSPRDDYDDDRNFEVAELKWNDELEVYQAEFTHRYDFQSGTFQNYDDEQIERTIRFDVEKETLKRGKFQGRVLDLWRGVTETQTQRGIRKVGKMIQYGDFEVQRANNLLVDKKKLTVRDPRSTDPGLLKTTEPTACQPSYFDVEAMPKETGSSGNEGSSNETWSCSGIDDAASFANASVPERTKCAVAFSADTLDEETTSEQLQSYIGEGQETGKDSFEAFLKGCADEQDDNCKPIPEAKCAMQLLSHAAKGLRAKKVADTVPLSDYQSRVMEEMKKMAGEAYLPEQLGAFYIDLDTRRSWLRQSPTPSKFVDDIEEAARADLEEWRKNVLEKQSSLVSRFFRPNALTAMGRPVSGQEATRARRGVLMQGGMLWRGTVEALTLAAKRWNRKIRNESDRLEQMRTLGAKAKEMYLIMGLLTTYNESTGASSQSALLIGDFADMLDAIESLRTPFTEALYSRDAEVVTATSLNPLTDNDSLLEKQRKKAKDIVEKLKGDIEELIKQLKAEALDESKLRNNLDNKLTKSSQRIASLCGLPEECPVDSAQSGEQLKSHPDTCIAVEPGECGLNDVDSPEVDGALDPSKVKTSKAGQEVLDVIEAYKNVEIAYSDWKGQREKARLELQEFKAFKSDVESWNQKRLQGLRELRKNLDAQTKIENQKLERTVKAMKQKANIRANSIASMQSRFQRLNKIRVSGAQSTFSSLMKEASLRQGAQTSRAVGEFTAGVAEASAAALPDVVGTANDPSSAGEATFLLNGAISKFASEMAAITMESAADGVAAARERNQLLREAKIARIEEQAEVGNAITDDQIATLESELERANKAADIEIGNLQDALRIAQKQRQAELAYERDKAKLREKRKNYKQMLVDMSGLKLKYERARFRVMQRMMEYKQVVQKARLEASRFREIQQQLSNLNSLLGGPSVIFLRFQELRLAEQNLERAREALMDWLVTLEYYAVRPFIEERIKILMARNPYQLWEIAKDLDEIQAQCGGSERSTQTATVSVRDDLMELDHPQQDLTGDLEPDERFRQSLQSGYVPVNRDIRYSTEESLGDVLGSDDTLATTFSLRLSEFANLPNACNAKIDSMSVQLVGDIGSGQPSVSLLYNGESKLRSCQPNIEEIVKTYGPELTNYGTVTYLNTAGRSASTVASINKFPDKNQGENRTLSGMPLSSQYTVLIDTSLPSNRDLDWSELEDVKLEMDYTYQDLFPESCK
jgi:hypothetical protein